MTRPRRAFWIATLAFATLPACGSCAEEQPAPAADPAGSAGLLKQPFPIFVWDGGHRLKNLGHRHDGGPRAQDGGFGDDASVNADANVNVNASPPNGADGGDKKP